MADEKLLREAVEFFRNEPGFRRLFEQFIKNYKSLGRIGGTVKLNNLTEQEKKALSGIMGTEYNKQAPVTISLKAFQKVLERTRFSGIELKDLLFSYSGEKVLTNWEEKEHYQQEKNAFFNDLANKYTFIYCKQWIEYIKNKGKGTRGIHLAYDQDPSLLKNQLINVLEALDKLPGMQNSEKEYQRIPVFANAITKDPHAFDLNTQQGKFLVSALQFIRQQEDKTYEISSSSSVEEMTELLSYFGLVRDDILNFASCAGILAFKESEKEPLTWWQKCWEEGVVTNVPLREIIKVESFYPAIAYYNNYKNVVFAVENSGVFSEILERFQEQLLPPLLCTNGQFKLATLLLLDGLVKNNTIIYYSGDFDPEGLQMAQRLLERYPQNVKLWHYNILDFEKCKSEVLLTSSRLKKLDKINLPLLQPIKDKMKKYKKAGYQEKLVPELVKDIVALIVEPSQLPQ
ncbi:MAG: hypothetical protein PWP71_1631 [Clostridia bacterium]|jgi:uncharacterized protein (TIGR02679 family)|nr:hypothetical protein [Clostridia bacterium]